MKFKHEILFESNSILKAIVSKQTECKLFATLLYRKVSNHPPHKSKWRRVKSIYPPHPLGNW